MNYTGRFAPSPTGPLHFGSLVTAVASFLDARRHGGAWLLRMEDLDRSRCRQEFSDSILFTLEAFGFTWDGGVLYQSGIEAQAHYAQEFSRLEKLGLIYPCGCSRKDREDTGSGEARYPGTCTPGIAASKAVRSWRVRVPETPIAFVDRHYGNQSQVLTETIGDFVLRHAGDGGFTYQFAVVADDARQNVTHIVRGADLLSSTPRQIYLQTVLGYRQPGYFHVPLVLSPQGQKLSKQTGAAALNTTNPSPELIAALRFLGMPVPAQLSGAPPRELWEWALAAAPHLA